MNGRRYMLVIVALLLVGAAPFDAVCQQKGQYLPGTTGLNSGIQPAPGFTYVNSSTFYNADRLKNRDGNAIPVSGSFDLYANLNVFAYTTGLKILGGNYGAMFLLPIPNGSLTAPVIGFGGGGAGIGDLYIEPINLGWHSARSDFRLAYGIVAPTGRFNPGATDNIGSDYWGNLFTGATTLYLTENKGTSLSAAGIWEVHSEKRHSDETPGQTFTLEWGLGQMLPVKKQLLQLGVAGYSVWQITDNSSNNPLIPNYSVHAIGPEVEFILPHKLLSFFFRYEPEFGGQGRVEGRTIVFGGGFTLPRGGVPPSP